MIVYGNLFVTGMTSLTLLTSLSFEKLALDAAVCSSFLRIPGGERAKLPSNLELPNTLANFLLVERKSLMPQQCNEHVHQ